LWHSQFPVYFLNDCVNFAYFIHYLGKRLVIQLVFILLKSLSE
jgi:hypothetical protein